MAELFEQHIDTDILNVQNLDVDRFDKEWPHGVPHEKNKTNLRPLTSLYLTKTKRY